MCSYNFVMARGPALAHTVSDLKLSFGIVANRYARAVHQRRAHPQQGATLPQSEMEWEMLLISAQRARSRCET
jgi:hypothetical protein